MTAPVIDVVTQAIQAFAKAPLPEDPEASLFDAGVIDSFGLMDLLTRLEEDLGVNVPDEELSPRRFENLQKIVRYFEAKL